MNPKWQKRPISEAVMTRALQWCFHRGDVSTDASELAFLVWLQGDDAHASAYAFAMEMMRAMRERFEARSPDERGDG
jgi:ferric-dicitrate binding protein FerR (iron transport regulator)